MQRSISKVTMSKGKVLSDSAQVLPCALEKVGCEITSIDPCAYIWDYTDNCVLSVPRTENFNMVERGTKDISLKDPIQQINLCLKLKRTLKNIVESQQIPTRSIMIHSKWQ